MTSELYHTAMKSSVTKATLGQVGEILLGPFFLTYPVMKILGVILLLIGALLALTISFYILFWIHWSIGLLVVGISCAGIGISILDDD